jgi:surface polysaccharide O-acyltransferase-like enzyme
MKSSKRLLYIDVIKILAILLVILLHSSANFIYDVKVNSFDFVVLNFFDSMARIGVPLFFMVSGAYFLNNKNDVTIKSIFKKNIFKILLVLIISSFTIELTKYLIMQNNITLKMFIKNVMLGDKVLWFFYTLIGLYIITPLLREITKSKEKTQYFIFLYFMFVVLFKYILLFYDGKAINDLYNKLSITMFNGYVGYYMLGYYLSSYNLSLFKKKILYVLGIFGFILTFALTEYYSIKTGKFVISFYKNNTLNVFFYAVGVFIFIKSICKDKTNNNKFIKQLANLTIAIYPVHRLLMIIIEKYFGLSITKNCIYMIPLYFIVLAILSCIISYIISLIVKKLNKNKIIFYSIYLFILFAIMFTFYLV